MEHNIVTVSVIYNVDVFRRALFCLPQGLNNPDTKSNNTILEVLKNHIYVYTCIFLKSTEELTRITEPKSKEKSKFIECGN